MSETGKGFGVDRASSLARIRAKYTSEKIDGARRATGAAAAETAAADDDEAEEDE